MLIFWVGCAGVWEVRSSTVRCLVLDRDSFQKLLGPLKAGHSLRDCVTSILLNVECLVYLSTILAICESGLRQCRQQKSAWSQIRKTLDVVRGSYCQPESFEKRSTGSRGEEVGSLRSLRSFPTSSYFSARSDGHALAPDREKVGHLLRSGKYIAKQKFY